MSSISSTSATSSSPSVTSITLHPSITTPFFSATSASQSIPGASASESAASAASPSSSSLYLYTFLATLVLLLGISAAIVVRSFILRRRHQGIIEEALRNGTWATPTFSGFGRSRRDLGEKPRMWEAWVGKDREMPGTEGHRNKETPDIQKGYDATESGAGWNGILPVSATYLNPLPPSTPAANPPVSRGHTGHRAILPWRQRTQPSSPAISSNVPSSSALSLPVVARAATSTLPPPPPPLPIPIPTELSSLSQSPSPSSTPIYPPAPTPNSVSNPTLRLTLLIAMPSPPSTRHARDDEEEGPPVVEFGLVDVDVRGSAGTTSASGTSNGPPSGSAGTGVET